LQQLWKPLARPAPAGFLSLVFGSISCSDPIQHHSHARRERSVAPQSCPPQPSSRRPRIGRCIPPSVRPWLHDNLAYAPAETGASFGTRPPHTASQRSPLPAASSSSSKPPLWKAI
jgi:hypothetical protein